MNLLPGILVWEDPWEGPQRETFEHVQTRETGGVAAFDVDPETEQPTTRVLELGPSTPWGFHPFGAHDGTDVEPDDGPVTVPALGPQNSEVA